MSRDAGSPYSTLYELTRGAVVESVHSGALAIADASGNLLAWAGNPQTRAYMRSTAKAFQALPFIELGGHTHFGFTPPEIALMCASHSGTEAHLAVARAMQARVGISESDLQCGTHSPYDEAAAAALLAAGRSPTPNHSDCSGKHTGMLAHARLKNAPLENYLDPDHPVQQSILTAFAEMCGLDITQVDIGIDGCSAPNFSVPLHNAATALARLAEPDGLGEPRATACHTLTAAMLAHPEMVSGPGKFDTELMQTAAGRVLSKGGAEGYLGLAVMPGGRGENSPALGIALKVADGAGRGWVRPAVALALLAELGALTPDELAALSKYGPRRIIRNWRGLEVGEGRPCYQLEWA